MTQDQNLSSSDRPGLGLCPDCGQYFKITGGGLLAEHPGCPNGSARAGRKPHDPVGCVRCGRTWVALQTTGECTTCARRRREAEDTARRAVTEARLAAQRAEAAARLRDDGQ
jgi:hypothetical protein